MERQCSYLNGKEIKASATPVVKDALVATGFPYQNNDRMQEFMNSMDFFFTNTHGVRRLGSAATDLAYVACGRFDGFYEYNLSPWDVAAGALLVTQAGGRVSDFSGGENFLFGREVVASNDKVFDEFQHEVARFLKP
jgi:myo-inositol-1(or 4)-monophosphatase